MFRNGTMPLMEDVLTMRENRNGAYVVFCENVLSQVVGKTKWKTEGHLLRMSEMATVSDEAFALILLENSYDYWEDMAMHCGDKSYVSKVQAKYTKNGAGTKKFQGWVEEGLVRFNNLARQVKASRKKDCLAFQNEQKEKKGEIEFGKGGKRKKRLVERDENINCYIEGVDDEDDEDDGGIEESDPQQVTQTVRV